jgi:hypothetical protein
MIFCVAALAACAHSASSGSSFSKSAIPWGETQDKFKAENPAAVGSPSGLQLKGKLAGRSSMMEIMFDESGALNIVNSTSTYQSMDDCVKALEGLKADWQ